MNKIARALAFDFGASGGRAIIGIFDGDKIRLEEVHRFSNDPVSVNGTVYWDTLRLLYEIKQGLIKTKNSGGFDSIGIDTWGVDFGFIDEYGNLIENPIHYRDLRTKGMIDEAFKTMSHEKLYSITGIQLMEFNTLFQLLSLKKNRPYIFDRADKMLFTPDLFAYMLTGKKSTEYSIATTSQLIDINTRSWSNDILDEFGFPKKLFTEISPAGTIVGKLSKEVCEECEVESVDVISVCGHDTQSAIAAVPSEEEDFVFISSGTWSLFGTELKEYCVNEKSFKLNLTNEGGYGGTVDFLNNINGLWLLQESRRHWAVQGHNYEYAELEKLALSSEPFKCFIDVDDPVFIPRGNIPGRVQDFCKKTGQYVPQTVGEIVRCIYESLAMKYKQTFAELKECTDRDYSVIHVIGGGTKDTLLCKMTANSCNRTVKAGPIEATVFGNIAVQLVARGEIESIAQARKIIARSEKITEYIPEEAEKWEEAYKKFQNVINS